MNGLDGLYFRSTKMYMDCNAFEIQMYGINQSLPRIFCDDPMSVVRISFCFCSRIHSLVGSMDCTSDVFEDIFYIVAEQNLGGLLSVEV